MTTKPSQSDELVRAAQQTGELFHDHGGVAYADVVAPEPAPHHEILRIRSRTFRTWLAGRYWRAAGRPAGGQALSDAIDVLASLAQFEGPERPIGLRIVNYRGAIYVDLGDDRWRVVEIDTAGWRVLERSPIPFRRPRGLLALPEPRRGGDLEGLREFVNVADDDQYRLLAGWLLGAFRPAGPYIVLVLTGEQDSAKTTTARLMRLLVDPNEVGDRTLPRDEHALAVAANNSWIASFDNVSTLADWQSDAIARMATGAGFGTRQLYSDDEEFLVHVARPIILNGIGGIVTRPDLMDRAIVVDLPAIPDARRRAEAEFLAAFDAARAGLLGSLLDAASAAFRREQLVDIKRLPRMADATRWITAAEGVLHWPERSFLAAYMGNRTSSRALTLEASPLAIPITALLTGVDMWSGTAAELLRALEERVGVEVVKRRNWPPTPAQLGTALRRLAPDLRKVCAIEVRFPHRHGTSRQIQLVRLSDSLSLPSPTGDSRDGDLQGRTNDAGSPSAPDLPVHAHYPPGAWDPDGGEDDPQAEAWQLAPLPEPERR